MRGHGLFKTDEEKFKTTAFLFHIEKILKFGALSLLVLDYN